MIDNNDLNDVFGEDAWYEPGENGSGGSVETGNHDEVVVDDLNIKRDIKVQGKYLADIYEPVFNINGKKIKHKGVFRFKKPDPSRYPDLQENPGSNAGYYALLNMMDMVQEKDGKMLLPEIDVEAFKRFIFNVEVIVEEWVGREGNDMKTPRVKTITKATQRSKEALMDDGDLPF